MTNDFAYSRFTTEFRVRPDDIDMFQHVHNSKYFDYVLAARYDQMERFYKMPMEEFMEQGYGWVVKTAHVDYKRPMSMGDEFIVETGIENMSGKGCRVQFNITIKKTGKIACDGWFDYVLIDIKSGRSMPVTEEMIGRYSI
ncbi:acyl-CoA thioesterase [Hufsiella ginkgonis]|uniref:Acyl-CoA thioesterase n=1 Tax=Hufsiella ginkgonis TaxID=2695274 RepID=A0A7K1XWX1_9SPHI|nr:acyl-CoA thioesterase [Hufsiella ginkgonis]MXV15503.1 acyl-CoA thioesterase [Hufsiella ginkgonis]